MGLKPRVTYPRLELNGNDYARQTIRQTAQNHSRRTASQTIRTAPRRTHPPVSPAVVKRTRRKILLGLYAFLLIELVVAFCTTPLLTIKRVSVRGLTSLPRAEAEETLRDSALPGNIHWLRVGTRTMQARLQQLPWVRSAIVTRRLFSNALTVTVTPRQPRRSHQIQRANMGGGLDRQRGATRPPRPAQSSAAHRSGQSFPHSTRRVARQSVASCRPGDPPQTRGGRSSSTCKNRD